MHMAELSWTPGLPATLRRLLPALAQLDSITDFEEPPRTTANGSSRLTGHQDQSFECPTPTTVGYEQDGEYVEDLSALVPFVDLHPWPGMGRSEEAVKQLTTYLKIVQGCWQDHSNVPRQRHGSRANPRPSTAFVSNRGVAYRQGNPRHANKQDKEWRLWISRKRGQHSPEPTFLCSSPPSPRGRSPCCSHCSTTDEPLSSVAT